MFGYTRTTRTCPVNQIHPNLAQAIREFFQTHQVGDADSDTVQCCETISTRPTPGRLVGLLDGNPDTNIHLAIVLSADWLVWARNGDQTGTVVTGAKLQVLKVKVYVRRNSKNMELEISGFMAGTKDYARGSLELGPDVAAQKFCEAVVAAILKAKPPAKTKFFGLINE
ncbi:MAG: hypothetical protein ABSA23_08725 [Anaerolineales bacterium]|jgi:hypothetical protein